MSGNSEQIREIMDAYEWVQDTKKQLGDLDIGQLIEAEIKEFMSQNPGYSEEVVENLLFEKNRGKVTKVKIFNWWILGGAITQVTYWKLRRK